LNDELQWPAFDAAGGVDCVDRKLSAVLLTVPARPGGPLKVRITPILIDCCWAWAGTTSFMPAMLKISASAIPTPRSD